MRKVCAKMVPKNLTTEQWANRGMCVLIFWTALRGSQNSSVALSQAMNYGFWSKTARQNAKVGSGTLQTLPVPRKREWENRKSNRCSFVFLTVRGSSTRNLCYQDKLSIKLFIGKSLKDSGKGWHVCDQALHHLDAAPRQDPMSHGSLHQWIFGRKIIPVVPQPPPLFPDLSPCDYFLFPRLKNHLKGRHFGIFDNIQKSVTDELKGIPAEAFQHCYEQWKQRLCRCVAALGNYFEGDKLDL